MQARAWEVFGVALRLGVTCFGGPIAHLGYFRTEYVERRSWLSDRAYAEIVALAQLLPGPSSSQVGMAVGYARAGAAGALAAWLGFTLPSAAALAVFAAVAARTDLAGTVWVHGLKLVAVAVVADAVLAMRRSLASTAATAAVAVVVAAAALVLPRSGPWASLQVALLAAAGGAGLLLTRASRAHLPGTVPASPPADHLPLHVHRRTGAAALAACVVLFAGLPLAAGVARGLHAPTAAHLGDLAGAMYRSGALVFGGGHVVLPLLQARTVPGLVSSSQFLTGYGAAQAVPGPLFTFAAFLGEVAAGPAGAVVATVAIFLPGALLLFGVLPFWQAIRTDIRMRAALVGVNAGVVGLLAAAFVNPVVRTSVTRPLDVAFAAGLFALLRLAKLPPWAVVLTGVVASPLLLLG